MSNQTSRVVYETHLPGLPKTISISPAFNSPSKFRRMLSFVSLVPMPASALTEHAGLWKCVLPWMQRTACRAQQLTPTLTPAERSFLFGSDGHPPSNHWYASQSMCCHSAVGCGVPDSPGTAHADCAVSVCRIPGPCLYVRSRPRRPLTSGWNCCPLSAQHLFLPCVHISFLIHHLAYPKHSAESLCQGVAV